ncbi:hypothetical protein Q2K19_22255 [Micromonospora soli]|uniref:hypothetical protein n=1 Tax=Micromonospora sp. NBRC 110009 TaxID=3061627 RepID=UPI0026735353|nr:hypothetical protein [Micromonospora sp. NBRC 110009]WKT96895.1 hypothetical protein Q2K19_22255 [Micromonospora sp. NBRC 110009]
MNVYPFIEAEQACRRSVKRACELMQVSRSAYYQHLRGERSERDRVDQALTEKITAVHAMSKGTSGRRGYTSNSPRPGCGTAVNASPG